MKTVFTILLTLFLIGCNSPAPQQQQQAAPAQQQPPAAEKISYTPSEIKTMASSYRNITWFAQKFGTPVTDMDMGKRVITYELDIKNEFGTEKKDVQFFFVQRGGEWICVDYSIF